MVQRVRPTTQTKVRVVPRDGELEITLNINVTVEGGVATLTGTVETWTERAAAEADAHQGGAMRVRNHIKVKNGREYYCPK